MQGFTSILLAALLLAAAPADAQRAAPQARAGVLDLSDWNLARDGIIDLAGEWEFSWGRFEEPERAGAGPGSGLIQVPAPWNDAKIPGKPPGADGYGTYRLRVECRETARLAMVMPIQHSAARYYVNGRVIALQGSPGGTPELARPAFLQQGLPLEQAGCPLQIVVHLSNFDMRNGGLLRSLELGTERQLVERRERGLARDLFALGGIFMLSLLPMLAFLWRRQDRAPLWLGIYGFTSAIFIGFVGERLFQPAIAAFGWQFAWKFTILNALAGQAAFPAFLRALYPEAFPRTLLRGLLAAAGALALLVLATPTRVFTEAVPLLYALIALVGAVAVAVPVRAALQGRRSAWLLVAGSAVLVASIAHDSLQLPYQISSKLMPYGLLAFALAPVLLLARRFARALTAEELRAVEQQQRADLLVHATQAGLLDWDATSNVTTYSDRFKEMLGYAAGTDTAKWPQLFDFIHPEDRERVRVSFLEQLRDRRTRSSVRLSHDPADYRLRRADGGYMWIHAEAISVTGADGRTLRYICSFIDISESKQQEIELRRGAVALRESDARHNFAMQAINEGVYDWNVRDGTIYYSDSVYRALGMPQSMKTPQDWTDRVHPEDRARYTAAIAAHFRGETKRFECEYRFRGGDGTWRWARQQGIAVRDEKGRAIRMVGATGDITEFKQNEAELASERQRLALVVSATQAGIIDWDVKGETAWFSGRFKEMLGYAADSDTSGWASTFSALIHPDDRDRSREVFFTGLVSTGAPDSSLFQEPLEMRLRRADGGWLWVQSMGLTLRDEAGEAKRYLAAVTDISARRAQEEELRNQFKFINDLLESVPVALALRDAAGKYLIVNRKWEEYFDARREDVIGRTVLERAGERMGNALLALDRAVLERGPGTLMHENDFEYGGRKFSQTRSVMADPQGKVLGVLVASLDTTERAAMDQRLREQIALTEAIVSQAPNSIFAKDVEGRFTLANRGWSEMSGVPVEKALGRTVHDLYPAAAAERFAEEDAKLLAQGAGAPQMESLHRGPKPDQYRLVRKSVLSRGDIVLGLVCSSTDISELKKLEQDLARQRERLELLVRSTKAGFVDWDAATDTRIYSERFKEMLGHPPDADSSAWPELFEMMHPEDREPMRKAFLEILRQGAESRERVHGPLEYRLRKADGSYLWVRGEGIAQVGAGGRTERFLTSYIDITPLREMNLALEESVRLREEVDRISRHDLKTPLNSIIGIPRLLRDSGRLSEEDAELLAFVEQAGYRLLNMVNLSLDMFQMERGNYPFTPKAVDLRAVLEKVTRDVAHHARSKRLELRVEGPRLYALAEELLCYSMFANLVKNAVEASPQGGVVSLTLSGDAERVTAAVHNAGAVPESVRTHFFEKYSTAGKQGGSGLGTYSARLMARTQQGEISMETSAAAGTTVTVRLMKAAESARDAEPAKTAMPEPATQTAPQELSVLVVDDDEYTRIFVQRFLPASMRTSTAVNGKEAFEAVQRDRPDVIVMDLDMPVMGGLEAAALIRKWETQAGHARRALIAMSSHDDPAISARSLQAGFDRYLTKPVSPDAIRRAVAELGRALGPGAAGPQEPVQLRENLRSALPGFLASRRELIDELTEAVSRGDSEGSRALAHKLAGSFALYGFHWAAAQGKMIERRAGANALAGLAGEVAALRRHVDTVRVECGGQTLTEAPQ